LAWRLLPASLTIVPSGGGAELVGQLQLSRWWWVGASLAGAVDPLFDDDSAVGDDVQRRLLRASIRGGLRWPFTKAASAQVGVGAGLLTAVAVRQDENGRRTNEEGAAFAELIAAAAWAVGGATELIGGASLQTAFALEGEDADSPGVELQPAPVPAPHPFLFGAAWGGVA